MVELNWLDRAVGFVSPHAALRRARARSALSGMTAANTRYYEAARQARSRGAQRADATSLALANAASLREEARYLVRNNEHAAKALDSWASHAAPIAARAMIPGVTRDRAKRVHDPIDRLWWEWSQTASSDGTSSFDAVQALGVRALIESGEFLLRRIDRSASSRLPLPFQVQFLEPEYLDHGQDRALDDGRIIVGGIEHSRDGRRIAYWLHDQHPGATRVFTRISPRSFRVPADQVAHVYEPRRGDQLRGVTWFAPALIRMRDLAEYDLAELVRKKIEACFVAFVSDDSQNADETLGRVEQTDEQKKDRIEAFEPGMISYSDSSRKVTFGEPKAMPGYSDYVRVQDRRAAAALGMTYELWTGDLSQVNFSSARMGLLQFRSRVRQVQNTVLIPRACEQVWRWFVQWGQDLEKLPEGTIWSRWTPPQWESVQPLDDAAEELMRMRSGTLTGPAALAARGLDWVETLDELDQWNAELDRRGIRLDSDPRTMTKSGAAQGTPASGQAPADDPDQPAEGQTNGRANGHAKWPDTLSMVDRALARQAEERRH
jgi:lambda family phage portal protein